MAHGENVRCKRKFLVVSISRALYAADAKIQYSDPVLNAACLQVAPPVLHLVRDAFSHSHLRIGVLGTVYVSLYGSAIAL